MEDAHGKNAVFSGELYTRARKNICFAGLAARKTGILGWSEKLCSLIGLCPNCWVFLLSSQTLLNNQQHSINSVLASISTKPHQHFLAVIKESLFYSIFIKTSARGTLWVFLNAFFKQEIFKTIEEEVWFNQTCLSHMLAGATKHVHTSTPPWLDKIYDSKPSN